MAQTDAATAARMRNAHQRKLDAAADLLRSAGYTVTPPEGDGEASESAYVHAQFDRLAGGDTKAKFRTGGNETNWLNVPAGMVHAFRVQLARHYRDA